MSFFIKEENVRPGNRGGRTLFNWNDIRLLNNKERESYLGVTQSIGFLDKGGKWRKRDWWQSKDKTTNPEINQLQILSEKERIKQEEQRLFNETFNNLYGTISANSTNKVPVAAINNNISNANTNTNTINNQKKEKLTVFEWKELMKKEANINPNDPKIFEFYENDEHKRGLGMKQNISFRTNPYEKDAMQRIAKLEGEGFENEGGEEQEKNVERKNSGSSSEPNRKKNKKEKKESKNRNLNPDYLQKKEHLGGKSYAEIMDLWEKEQLERKKIADYAHLENSSKSKKDKKEKKEKKDKKEKKNKKEKKAKKISERDKSDSKSFSCASREGDKKREKRRNKSRSRSRSRSDSRRRHRD